MATSPNFNWPEPDNTDLVKNGALAIRTAVDAIDASMAELKGGTTGQVLSKTSNTDMDFTWVAQDDSNAIQNAIVDAKGDLIAATADNTPARLAVGANGRALIADSTASTGLAYSVNAPLGGMSVLGSSGLSGASTVTVSGFSNKSRFWLDITGLSTVNTGVTLYVRFNSDSGNNYGFSGCYFVNGGTSGSLFVNGASVIQIGKTSTNAADITNYWINVNGGFGAGIAQVTGGGSCYGTSAESYVLASGYYFQTSQITSVTIFTSSGNFDAGNITVWGA